MGGVNGSNYDGTTLCTGNIAGAVDAGESKLRQVSFRILWIKEDFLWFCRAWACLVDLFKWKNRNMYFDD